MPAFVAFEYRFPPQITRFRIDLPERKQNTTFRTDSKKSDLEWNSFWWDHMRHDNSPFERIISNSRTNCQALLSMFWYRYYIVVLGEKSLYSVHSGYGLFSFLWSLKFNRMEGRGCLKSYHQFSLVLSRELFYWLFLGLFSQRRKSIIQPPGPARNLFMTRKETS